MNPNHEVLLLEFSSRKACMLSIEERQFHMFVVFEALFAMYCLLKSVPTPFHPLAFQGLTIASAGCIAHLLALHFKMILLEKYFRALENYFTENGQLLANWDSTIMPDFVKHWANGFLPCAALAAAALIAQFGWMVTDTYSLLWGILSATILTACAIYADLTPFIGQANAHVINFQKPTKPRG